MKKLFAALLAALALTLAWAPSLADTVLLAAFAEDVLEAETLIRQLAAEDSVHVVILREAGSKTRRNVDKSLEAWGAEPAALLGGSSVKKSSATVEKMKKAWGTRTFVDKVASLLRRKEADRLVFFSTEEAGMVFLQEFAQECALAANDPSVRLKKQNEDEYLRQVDTLINGRTLEAVTLGQPTLLEQVQARWGVRQDVEIPGLPECNGEGFLPQGEYVYRNEAEGLWAYVSSTLRIVITRSEKNGVRWFEADIRRTEDGELLHAVTSLNGRANAPDKVARERKLVLGINTDYYHYRINMDMTVGLVIRNGKVIHEAPTKLRDAKLPPLDTLILDDRGTFQVNRAGEITSETALAQGARDVFAFGPMLLKDGRLRMPMTTYYYKKEPRTAIGKIGENHYLMLVVEGRLKDSPGISLTDMAQLLMARGCTDAINLDGGHTSVMIFMGERLNVIGDLDGSGTTKPRNMAELLGIGFTEYE